MRERLKDRHKTQKLLLNQAKRTSHQLQNQFHRLQPQSQLQNQFHRLQLKSQLQNQFHRLQPQSHKPQAKNQFRTDKIRIKKMKNWNRKDKSSNNSIRDN